MDWDEFYRKGEVFWDKDAPSPPIKQYLERQAVRGRALVPGCGRGHEVALAVAHGLEATGLDIAPTGVAEARARYPQLAERFVTGSLFDPPVELRGAFDVVLEHTCMSALPPTLRADYRRGIDLTLRRGGLLIGVWFINPALDPGEEGPPYPLSVADLTALFADSYEIVEDYVPDAAFAGREGRERVRVLRRVACCGGSARLFLPEQPFEPPLRLLNLRGRGTATRAVGSANFEVQSVRNSRFFIPLSPIPAEPVHQVAGDAAFLQHHGRRA